MKIYYDYQMLIEQKYGGVTRYFYELVSEIGKTDDAEAEIHCVLNKNAYFSEYFNKKECEIPHSSVISRPINQFLSLNVWGKNCDIIHPTFYDPYILKRNDAPIVITVYDMIHELLPDMIGYNATMINNKAEMVHSAAHIIAISESTKRDLIKVYPDISPDKISVVHLGCNKNTALPKPLESLNLSDLDRYILFVGGRGGYKNFTGFVEAMKPVLKKDHELKIVCAGGGAFSQDEKDLINDVRNQVIQVGASDSVLNSLYYSAICFVFPSLYEGFGIPTLEAFANNCPAVISNTSSMPEVGGDAVEYFDPGSIDDMRETIEAVIYSDEKRNNMRKLGAKRLEEFSWKETANKTIECYREVLSKK